MHDSGRSREGENAYALPSINEGLLEPEWAPGGRPYQERLALVGKALFKLLWTPEQGANQKDVTTCRACHSQPSDGASSRGLYTLERLIPDRPEIGSQTNAGSMFGSGAAELLVSRGTTWGPRCSPTAARS